MRRSRIKAVANVPVRRKIESSKSDTTSVEKSSESGLVQNENGETSSDVATNKLCPSAEGTSIEEICNDTADIDKSKLTEKTITSDEVFNFTKENEEKVVESCNFDLDNSAFDNSSNINEKFDDNTSVFSEVYCTSENLNDTVCSNETKEETLIGVNTQENVLDTTENIVDSNVIERPKISHENTRASNFSNSGIKILSVTNITDNTDLSLAYRKPPLSPCKVLNRPRIRSTPRLGHRRNSTSASESEDDTRRSYVTKNKSDTVPVSTVQTPSEEVTSNVKTDNSVSQSSPLKSVLPKKKVRRSDIARKMAEAKRDFYNKFGSKIPDRQKLTMMDLIFYNPPSNPMPVRPKKKPEEKVEETIENTAIAEEEAADEPEEEALPVPQVKIGENGEIILDEQSLVIETSDTRKARELTSTAINYDDLDTGYGIYKRAKRTKEWTDAETKQFYRVLQMIGTDFTMMMSYFKDRTRRDLKLKFKKEEKINRSLIDKVLLNPCTLDLDELQKALDRDREILRQQEEEKKRREELKQAEIEKRKRKPNTKRVRYKTGSWFARQMFIEKSEMSAPYDTVEIPNINNNQTKDDENNLNSDSNSPPRKRRSQFIIDNINNSDEDPDQVSTTKQLNNIFGKPTRSGRIIKTKINLQDENFTPNNFQTNPEINETTENISDITVIENINEDSLKDTYILPHDIENPVVETVTSDDIESTVLEPTSAVAPVYNGDVTELAADDLNQQTIEKESNAVENEQNLMVEAVQMKSIISNSDGELIETNLEILENYLAGNDSITLELPVVDKEEIVGNSENSELPS